MGVCGHLEADGERMERKGRERERRKEKRMAKEKEY